MKSQSDIPRSRLSKLAAVPARCSMAASRAAVATGSDRPRLCETFAGEFTYSLIEHVDALKCISTDLSGR